MSECEWNPQWRRPALDTDPPHGIAVWSVGKVKNWHLCEECAKLPEFDKYRKRTRLKIAALQAAKGGGDGE